MKLNGLNIEGRLPSNARLVTADVISMYTNIDTEHGLEILRSFLGKLKDKGNLPVNIDIDTIAETAAIVMHWNLFEYGDCFFQATSWDSHGNSCSGAVGNRLLLSTRQRQTHPIFWL